MIDSGLAKLQLVADTVDHNISRGGLTGTSCRIEVSGKICLTMPLEFEDLVEILRGLRMQEIR